MRKTLFGIAVAISLVLTGFAQTKEPCDIPGYPKPGDARKLNLSWCPIDVDFQVRIIALIAAGKKCQLSHGSISPDEIQARLKDIDSSCKRLQELDAAFSGNGKCLCPDGYAASPAASPEDLAEEEVRVITHCVKPLRRSIVSPNLEGTLFSEAGWEELHRNLSEIDTITLVYKRGKNSPFGAPDIVYEEDGEVVILSENGIRLTPLNTVRDNDHFILGNSVRMDQHMGSEASHYYFKLDEEGVGELFWGSLRQNMYLQETFITRARCGKLTRKLGLPGEE